MTLLHTFTCKRVGVNEIWATGDQDLKHLRKSTIGDRCTLRDACKAWYSLGF